MATLTATATCKCSNLFEDPRMLPCLHSFCLVCLSKASEIQGAKEALQCPTCSEKAALPNGRVENLPVDLRKAHEAEVARYGAKLEEGKEACDICVRRESGPAIAFCVNCCEFLCKSCVEHHRSARKSQKHEVFTVGAVGEKSKKGNGKYNLVGKFHEPPMPCSTHTDEVLKFYCEQCEKLICRDCMELEHNDHRSQCNRVEAIAAKAMESLEICFEDSEGAVANLEDAIAQCKETMQQVESRKKEVDNTITRSLNQVREALLTKNEEIRLGKITSLKIQVEELEKVRDDLSYASDTITKSKSHTPAQQLATKKVIADRAAQLLQRFHDSKRIPLESTLFLTKVAEQATISEMIALGQISGGSVAASSTCDVGYVPRVVVGVERTIKVTGRNKEGKPFPHGQETVTAELSLMGSEESRIHGKSTDLGDGTYSVTFTAKTEGEHELQVRIADRPIRGSPFTLTARLPRTTPYDALSQQKVFSTYQNPWDVAFAENGSLAVVEHTYHTVSLYSVDGKRLHTFGSCGSSGSDDNRFSSPTGVAIRGDVMYVTEHSNHRVQKFSISQQSFISKFGSNGSGNGQFSSPRGICIDPEGNVFIADYSNNRVQVFEADGTFAYAITADPENAESKFQNPWGLAFDPQGRLHIAAYTSKCITVYTPEGTFVESYGVGTLNNPAGIAIDEEGYIAISEYSSNHRLWIYNPDHTQLVNTIQNKFGNPAGIACDSDGMFWIAEHGNSRVQKY